MVASPGTPRPPIPFVPLRFFCLPTMSSSQAPASSYDNDLLYLPYQPYPIRFDYFFNAPDHELFNCFLAPPQLLCPQTLTRFYT